MCPKKEWFSIYEPFEGGKFLMGDDVSCKTVETNSIHMKMFDGQVRILKNVSHIPDLEKIFSHWGPWKLKDTSSQVRMEF